MGLAKLRHGEIGVYFFTESKSITSQVKIINNVTCNFFSHFLVTLASLEFQIKTTFKNICL